MTISIKAYIIGADSCMADDREHLKTLLTALDASPRSLRREPLDGRNKVQNQTDYAIIGRDGHIYADGNGWLICIVEASSSMRWLNIKRRLSFCHPTQDGDDEGCLQSGPAADPDRSRRHPRGDPREAPEATCPLPRWQPWSVPEPLQEGRSAADSFV
jgi:hypothetical protein